ncbi:PREDICTED: ER membrane protein complex subunit 10 [Ceratosolen solmsi marchali]|uniref:ER membrane protein complex subunit 10 n=1 Tax=Ceratosolen solmsi marchali TaxID=326594 RepID=A0AAJ6YPQ0_9HYME|nr:PREDICTED: ER membrane protein complex subunit 10 [Ceratosolen solmsi marchali]
MKMHTSFAKILLVLSLSSFISASELDFDGWLQIRLWHSFDDEPTPRYVERGKITISSIRSGAAVVSQPGLHNLNIDKLNILAKHGGKYRLKAIVQSSSGSEITFLTSILACNLLGSNLQDTLNIWLDSSAEPIAVNLVSQGPCSLKNPTAQSWTTDVQMKYPDGGPMPDTATYIQKLEREKQARESGENKDNRSFFAKYWMYVIPAVIFVVLSSATNPEAGNTVGSGGGGAQRQ